MEHKIKIALADDEILIRQGIRNLLDQEDNIEILFDVSNGIELISKLSGLSELPDIILMDINMPELNGIDATKKITTLFPEIKIIALSSYNSISFIKKMLSVGAVCYIPKNFSPTDLIIRINKVFVNGFFYEKSMLDAIDKDNKALNLEISDREIEVLQLICQQKSASEIAEILKISSRTVDNHRNSLLQKTNSKNIIGLVIYAIQNQLFIPYK
ncbi:response regulator [Flavobacterium sp.]|uniref:response regulator transcription factor n=1 Tax=Flavobacterium sp. TaxID=239 RepID=UPI00374D5E1E